jgi:uncharacterized protein
MPDEETMTADTDRIAEVLKTAKNIAVVGLSDNPMRASYGVAKYMEQHGYRIIPVNPSVQTAIGHKAYPNLSDVPDPIDIVNVFRRPEAVPAIVDDVIKLKVPVLWLQETVVHEEAAEKARRAGVYVVMDRCILKEHRARRL